MNNMNNLRLRQLPFQFDSDRTHPEPDIVWYIKFFNTN
jgi:hypothetical protein